MRFVLPRLLGVVRASYGVAIFAKPELLLKQAGMLRGNRSSEEQATFVRTLAGRGVRFGDGDRAVPVSDAGGDRGSGVVGRR
ncbi:MAG TPA: hypothetical protein VFE65_04035 [Pseudonocardia sp.]|nr:hypothetical protein [Pseudonocardia sp.]